MTVGDLYTHLDAQFLGRSPEPGREVCYTDYAHVGGGVAYHGMLSNADGPARATWRYPEGGRTVTLERVIGDRTFEQLFVGIGVLPAFRRALCNDMGRTVDSAAAHVISHVWPDFDRGAFEQSLEEFAVRARRFGGR